MSLEINAPDRGEYENFDRYIKFDDSNKYIRLTADRIQEQNSKYYLKNGEHSIQAILLQAAGDWFIRPNTREETSDTFDVKISKQHAQKIIDEFQ